MPKTSVLPPDLTPEEHHKLSQDDWRFIEAKSRKVLKGLLRGSTSKDINTRELVDIMRSAAEAKKQAYPDAAFSELSVNAPARLLKPIELAILAQMKSVDRGKPGKRLDVHSQDAGKPIGLKANSDSESVQFGTSDKDHSGNSSDNVKSRKESKT